MQRAGSFSVAFCVLAVAALASEDLTFVSSLDGTTQRYIKIAPTSLPAEGIDVMLWFHGHGSDRTQIAQSRGECSGSRDFCEENGMLLISPDYRAKTSWMGPAAEADVLQLIGILKETYDVSRIFLVGGSMGGTSALTFAARHPSLVDGVAAFNPLADHMTYENFQDAIAASFGGTKAEIPEEYRARSAINYTNELTMPLSITVGGADKSVPPESARLLAERVEALHPGNVYLDDVATRGHATDYDATLKALRQMLCRANGTDYDEVYSEKDVSAETDALNGLVAWWPFGGYGLNDASGNGHALVAGTSVRIGAAASLAGTTAGDQQASLSASGIGFAEMDAVSVELWVRYREVPPVLVQFYELSPNFNSNPGAFILYYDPSKALAVSGLRSADGYSIVSSGSDVIAAKNGVWRHLAAVYPHGPFSGFRLYVDGVDVTAEYDPGMSGDSTSAKFRNGVLYFGGRAGLGKFAGDLDAIKVWSRSLTAAEVRSSYLRGPDYSPEQLQVVGYPANVPCSRMSPAYGVVECAKGERVDFSAESGIEGCGISGWCVYTNTYPCSQTWAQMAAGGGAHGDFIHPGVLSRLEWRFDLPSNPIAGFTSPIDARSGTARFSYFATNGSAGDVRIKVAYGVSPQSLNATNDLALVTSACNLEGEVTDLPPGRTVCMRLLAAGPDGDVLFASPIGTGRQSFLDTTLCHYPFGEAGYTDVSGNGLDLAASGLVSLADGAVSFATAKSTSLRTTGNLDLSGLSAFVASCWVRHDAPSSALAVYLEQNAPQWFGKAGAFCISYDNSAKYLNSVVGSLAVSGSPNLAIVASDQGGMDAEWHNLSVVCSKADYPDDVQLYVDGVNRTREITAAEKPAYRGSAAATTFASAPLTLGGRGSTANLVGQMDEVLVAAVSEASAEAAVAEIYAKGLLEVKGEGRSVLVEVPDGCPEGRVFPPSGLTLGYAQDETVPVVYEGPGRAGLVCKLSTNAVGTASWVGWKLGTSASGAFRHPGVPVKVSWCKRGLVIVIR